MLIIYDFLYLTAIILYLPAFLLRGKFHRGLFCRFGVLPRHLKLDRPIWIHAVSVGEAVVMKGLLAELRLKFPEKKFVISTVTPTGNKIARSMAKEGDFVTYLPLDLSFIISAVIKKIDPSLFVIAETEIWPGLFNALDKRGVRIAVVNARISDSSLRGYYGIRFLIRPVLNKVSLFCAQTERDARRLLLLGVDKAKLCVTGNMKFDLKPADLNFRAPRLRLKYDEKLLVCGSTHPGEEELILTAYKELRQDFPDLRLLIAPRHPERSAEVADIVKRSGLHPVMTSSYEQTLEMATPVYILDTVGELPSFYGIAYLVFVGGSLVKKGGHNILEPAALGKPIIFGPQMFNFRYIARLFLKNRGALQVNSAAEFKVAIRSLLSEPSLALSLGERAKELIKANQGATLKNLDCILSLMQKSAARDV